MNNKNYSFILLVITLAFFQCIRLSKQGKRYARNNDDNRIIFNGDFDPSPKDLPESFIKDIVNNAKLKKKNNASRINFNKTNIDTILLSNDTSNFFPNQNSSKNKTICHDPTSLELTNKYSTYLTDKLHKINMMLIPAKTKKHHNLNSVAHFASLIENVHTNKTYGSKQCSKIRVRMLNYTSPLCPWHYMEVERKDRYPFFRVNVVCNCKKCLSESSSSLGMCQPVKIPMPVLYRGRCNLQTGLYEWNYAIEDVSNACVCTI
jgi:hypothetical protein